LRNDKSIESAGISSRAARLQVAARQRHAYRAQGQEVFKSAFPRRQLAAQP